MKKQISFLLIATFITMNASFAASNYQYDSSSQVYSGQPLRGSVLSVPAGAVISAVTTSEIGSETLVKGQAVQLALGSDFYYNGKMIAPAGSTVYGTVTELSKAKYGDMNGRVKILFTQITTPYGVQIPISGVIKTNDGSGVLVGGTKMDVTKEYAKNMAVGTAAGALSGLVFGALAGGDVGRGAALGTAVGAGGGAVKAAAKKGNPVSIPANSRIDILLNQPITVNPSAYSYED